MSRFAFGFLFLSCAVAVHYAHAQSPKVATSEMHSAYGEKLRIAGIHNAGKVTDQLYRGAQPRSGGLAQLKGLGITTIVDLRGEDSGTRDREKAETESLGIHFISIPVSGWSVPSADQVAEFLSLFGSNSNEKVFVHCRLGEDRTGVFVATYRMSVQKWPAQQAINEMRFFGFNSFLHRAMISYVRDFPFLLTSAPALAAWSNSESSSSAATQPN